MYDSMPLSDGRLSDAQVAQYWEDGFLYPISVMSPAEAQGMRDELERIESDWLDAGLPLPLASYKRVNSHCVMPLAHRIASHPRILDVVEGVLGPDILIYAVEFFIKEPNTKQIVGMHQDLTYWGLGEIDGLVTAWLALSPATTSSGCMDLVRGSHKNPILPHDDTYSDRNMLSRGQEIQVDVAEEDRTAVELQPGQISLHHGLAIHGSGPNVSDDRRIGAVVRYCTPEISQKKGDKDYVMAARGADRARNFIHIAPPQALFEPHQLALYDEIRAEQAKVMMAGAKTKGIYG